MEPKQVDIYIYKIQIPCVIIRILYLTLNIKNALISFHLILRYQFPLSELYNQLTHWGRVTQIYVSNLTIIASDNGLSPGRRQAIIWTSAGILLLGPSGTNFSEILVEIITFSFKKMRLKVSSAKWWPCCFGLNVLTAYWFYNSLVLVLPLESE